MSKFKKGDRVVFVGDVKRNDGNYTTYTTGFNPKDVQGRVDCVTPDHSNYFRVKFDSNVGGWGDDENIQDCRIEDLELVTVSVKTEDDSYEYKTLESDGLIVKLKRVKTKWEFDSIVQE